MSFDCPRKQHTQHACHSSLCCFYIYAIVYQCYFNICSYVASMLFPHICHCFNTCYCVASMLFPHICHCIATRVTVLPVCCFHTYAFIASVILTHIALNKLPPASPPPPTITPTSAHRKGTTVIIQVIQVIQWYTSI